MPPAKPAADATLASLYKAILAAPDDDLPRLVYADRLDELGDHARAEFIRLQIHVANTNPWDDGHADALVKSEVLYDRHAEAWGIKELTNELMRSRGVTPGVFNPFVRGFPEITWANVPTFSAAHRKTLKKYPTRKLVLVSGYTSAVERINSLINEVGVPAVDLSDAIDPVSTLTDGPALPSVRKLELDFDLYSPTAKQVRGFAASGKLPNVESLQLGGHLDNDRLRLFLQHLRWPKLHDLTLLGLFDRPAMEALAAADWAERVERLHLESVRYRFDGQQPDVDLVPLFRSKRLTNLRSLTLDAFSWPPQVERAFVESVLGPLDHFQIDGWCDPPVSDFPALLSAPALASVKSLDLPRAMVDATDIAAVIGRNGELRQLNWGALDFSPNTWATLANSPASQSLRRLHLERADLTADAVKALLTGPPWPHLAELVVKYGANNGRAVARLIDHPNFSRLTHLDLDAVTQPAHLWKWLAGSKTVGRFHKLRLACEITDAQLTAVLDTPEVCEIGRLALPRRVKVSAKTQRRYHKVFGVKITRDW